jgi:hypothetical protein
MGRLILATAVIAIAADRPLALERLRIVILCDASASGGGGGARLVAPGPNNRARAELIRALDRHLKGGSAVRVASFGDRYLASPAWVSTSAGIGRAFERVLQPYGDQSPLWDAVYSAAETLEETSERRILFIVSDGKASGNVRGFEEAFVRIRKANVTVHVANDTGRRGGNLKADEPGHPAARLKEIAHATGGEYGEPTLNELPGFLAGILSRLGQANTPSPWAALDLRLVSPPRPWTPRGASPRH